MIGQCVVGMLVLLPHSSVLVFHSSLLSAWFGPNRSRMTKAFYFHHPVQPPTNRTSANRCAHGGGFFHRTTLASFDTKVGNKAPVRPVPRRARFGVISKLKPKVFKVEL